MTATAATTQTLAQAPGRTDDRRHRGQTAGSEKAPPVASRPLARGSSSPSLIRVLAPRWRNRSRARLLRSSTFAPKMKCAICSGVLTA